MLDTTAHRHDVSVAALVNQDSMLASMPVRASEARTFGPAQPVMATPAAVAFAAATVAAFGVGFNVTYAVAGG